MCTKLVRLFLLGFVVLLIARDGISQVTAPVPSPPPPTDLGPKALTAPYPLAAKDSPKKLVNIWTMHMEQVEGRNIVRATIGKKHEIRIECDAMDYQTQKGVFTAQGKVELSGVSVLCRCERLTVILNDDRLRLEGKVEVRTFKERKYEKEEEVGNPDRILLQLTGEQLSLRWPDLQIKAASLATPASIGELPGADTIKSPLRTK